MSVTKSKNKVRIIGGNNAYFKYGSPSAWVTAGNINTGKLSYTGDTVEITFPDNTTLDLDGKTKCTLDIILAQSSKDDFDLVDILRSAGPIPFYYYNGIVDGKHQEFYFPQVRVIPQVDTDFEAGKVQLIKIKLSAQPQDTLASCIPNTDLPTDKHATGSTAVTGVNQYFVILETAVSGS